VDPSKFQGKGSFDRNGYTAAVLAEQLATTTEEKPVEPAAVEEVVPAVEPVETPADAVPEVLDAKPEEKVVEEELFQLEPEAIVTPESLTQMVTDNPEFGKLLEADSRLKGQLYKTAREAAELQPYREIFPDLESAKEAASSATTFNDVRQVFMGSTTKEGAAATLGKLAELCYERDEKGDVLMQDGSPVIGDDFYSFVDNVVAMDLEHDLAEVNARIEANQYHIGATTQEEVNDAWGRDVIEKRLLEQKLQKLSGADTPQEDRQALPENLRRKAEELDQREKALNTRQHGEKVEERRTFESGLQTEAQTRIHDGIAKIIANVEKQGGAISQFLKEVLPKTIGAALIAKIQGNPGLQSQMQQLQRLPIGDASRTRRLAAIDRAVQQYLPDVARAEIAKAGVQLATGAAAKRAAINAQADKTKQTEIRGSTAPAGTTKEPMSVDKAFEIAEAEWKKANPGRRFDTSARNSTLSRAVQLQLQ
jgi:hypothetical protein